MFCRWTRPSKALQDGGHQPQRHVVQDVQGIQRAAHRDHGGTLEDEGESRQVHWGNRDIHITQMNA